MKKSSYILGIISLSLILIAVIFKAQHFPFSTILMTVSFSMLTLIFLPTALIELLKSTDDKLLKWVYISAFISFFIDFVGMLFKVLHWPGASILLTIGVPIPFVLFLPSYIYYHGKRKLKPTIGFFSIMLFMVFLGVFSAMLAISDSKSLLFSHIKDAEVTQIGNQIIEDAQKTGAKTTELVEIIETLKVKTALAANKNNKQYIINGKIVDYKQVLGKDKRFGNLLLQNDDYTRFVKLFARYQDNHKTDELSKMLLNDIYNSISNNTLSQLSLADMLSIFCNWQNKLLLVDYRSTSISQ